MRHPERPVVSSEPNRYVCPAIRSTIGGDTFGHCWERTATASEASFEGRPTMLYSERCRHCPARRQVRERTVVDVVQHYNEGWRPA